MPAHAIIRILIENHPGVRHVHPGALPDVKDGWRALIDVLTLSIDDLETVTADAVEASHGVDARRVGLAGSSEGALVDILLAIPALIAPRADACVPGRAVHS